MRSRKKTIITAAIVGVIAAIISTINTPSFPESCREFREQMQQLAFSDSGLAGVIAAVPEEVMEKALSERYGAMPAEQCTARSQSLKDALEALSHTQWSSQMGRADDEVKQAMKDCHDKRLSGALKTHADSAQCSNSRITAAFERIGYPYKDLVGRFTAKRLEMAQKLDEENSGGTEDELEYALLALEIAEQESMRVAGAK